MHLIYHLFNKNGGRFKSHVTFSMEIFVTIARGFQTVTVVANSYLIDGARFIGPFSQKYIKIYIATYMENVNSFHIITNNIKGMQNKNKRLSIIEYLKNKIGKNGILFLQETHSTISDEGKWKDEFSGPVLHSCSTSNSCGVLITFFGENNVLIIKLLPNMDKY